MYRLQIVALRDTSGESRRLRAAPRAVDHGTAAEAPVHDGANLDRRP
jgi:hypothetical protein